MPSSFPGVVAGVEAGVAAGVDAGVVATLLPPLPAEAVSTASGTPGSLCAGARSDRSRRRLIDRMSPKPLELVDSSRLALLSSFKVGLAAIRASRFCLYDESSAPELPLRRSGTRAGAAASGELEREEPRRGDPAEWTDSLGGEPWLGADDAIESESFGLGLRARRKGGRSVGCKGMRRDHVRGGRHVEAVVDGDALEDIAHFIGERIGATARWRQSAICREGRDWTRDTLGAGAKKERERRRISTPGRQFESESALEELVEHLGHAERT